MDAAGDEEIGCDGRLLNARRFRRHRLGVMSGQIRGDWRTGANSVTDERFVQRDECRVAEKLCYLQALEGRERIVW